MKCDKCKTNEANFHKVSNINGKVSEVHLCSDCAKKSTEFDFDKEFDKLNFGAKSFFDDIMSDFKTSFSYFTNPMLENFLDFDVFDSFGDSLFNSRVLPETKHLEKVEKQDKKQPIKLSEDEKKKLEIQKLDLQLKKAVVEERYEDAVKLRDKLKELKK